MKAAAKNILNAWPRVVIWCSWAQSKGFISTFIKEYTEYTVYVQRLSNLLASRKMCKLYRALGGMRWWGGQSGFAVTIAGECAQRAGDMILGSEKTRQQIQQGVWLETRDFQTNRLGGGHLTKAGDLRQRVGNTIMGLWVAKWDQNITDRFIRGRYGHLATSTTIN